MEGPPIQGMRKSEKASWALGLVGQNLIYSLQLNFALFAFVEIQGLVPTAVGTMLFLARVFDGFNDPIMGVVADRTRTRWGRFRPWLVVVPLPIALATAAMFFDPGLSAPATLAYAYVVYFGWSILYTLSDIPLWALSSVMTRDVQERTGLVALGRVGAMLGMLLPSILLPVIAGALAPQAAGRGYFLGAAIFAALSVPLMMLAGLGTRERVALPEERARLGELWNGLWVNRPLQLIVLSALLGSLAVGAQGAYPFFARYNLGDDRLVGFLFGASVVSLVIGVAAIPWLTRRLGKVRCIVFAALFRTVLLLGWYAVGWESLPLCVFFVTLLGLSMAPWIVHLTTMIGDSIDYVEARTGQRHEGIAFSLQTLSAKVAAGVGALVTGAVLAATGFVANQEQRPEALQGIFAMLTLIPAASSLVSILPFRWYPITEELHAEIVAGLEAER